MSDISTQAAAARESARTQAGQFGVQDRTAPGDLPKSIHPASTMGVLIARLRTQVSSEAPDIWPNRLRAFDVRDADIEAAVLQDETGDPESIMEDAVAEAGARRGPRCDRHGGRWGFDETCETCTDVRGEPVPLPSELDPQHWRDLASEARTRSRESFERSDSDGSTSQWAADMSAAKYDLQARIAGDGGQAPMPALFDTDGNLVPAKLVSGRYGQSWGLLSDGDDPNSPFTDWVNCSNASTPEKRRAAMAKKGYREGAVWADAKADLAGSGHGLAGAMSVHPVVKRLDGGFSKDAEFAEWMD